MPKIRPLFAFVNVCEQEFQKFFQGLDASNAERRFIARMKRGILGSRPAHSLLFRWHS
jgi:hypothetical protein